MVVVDIDPVELAQNNVKLLKLRKESFKKHLVSLFTLGGHALIIILYLKNASFLRFVVRFLLHNTISSPFPPSINQQLSSTIKNNVSRTLFVAIIVINALFLLIDLIVGVPKSFDETSTFLFGSLTLEIIGETRPTYRLSYIYYNGLIFCFQYGLIYLSTILNTNEEVNHNNVTLPGTSYSINQIEGDGYTGIVKVASINPKFIYNKILSFSVDAEQENDEDEDEATYNYISSRLESIPGMF